MKEDQFYRIIIFLFGSWWSILAHALLFTSFLLFSKDLLFFTMFLSVEAILIGILILMAESREQIITEKRMAERRFKDRELVREDVNITQNVMDEIKLLKRHQIDSTKALEEIRQLLKNNSDS